MVLFLAFVLRGLAFTLRFRTTLAEGSFPLDFGFLTVGPTFFSIIDGLT